MIPRQILTNANVVLPDRTVHGSVVVEGERIAEISATRRYPEGLDLQEQFLIPGVIDIHTDYMEKELNPRPSANFPLNMAFHFMDVRAIACGLTTVLGAARISDDEEKSTRTSIWRGDGLALAKAYPKLAIFPGDRFGEGAVVTAPRPGGGQRFAVEYALVDGCHACARLGVLRLGFDFDGEGKYLGVSVLSVLPSAR